MFEDDEHARIEKLPIYLKGKEVLEVVYQITELISDDDHLRFIKDFIIEDALQLTSKVVSAEGGDLYDLRMENAAMIRNAAQDLIIQSHSLELFGFEYIEYYSLVRDLVEEYRLLFLDWVAGFDKWNYMVDRWGLFNPPGVGPFDPDPEGMDDEC